MSAKVECKTKVYYQCIMVHIIWYTLYEYKIKIQIHLKQPILRRKYCRRKKSAIECKGYIMFQYKNKV